MADFGGVDYAPELFAIQDSIESIDTDMTRILNAATAIQSDMNVIESKLTLTSASIGVFEELGTSCNQGIKLVRRDDRMSRALSLMSFKDSGQLEDFIAKLDDPDYTDYDDLMTEIFGS